ncbi:MAG TPA: tetratricopeptide repeat protein [Pyrinomonadaceae bacterium]|nr:tetratricopeptide repeat protein [Pyrinomonadaceae bacterium]
MRRLSLLIVGWTLLCGSGSAFRAQAQNSSHIIGPTQGRVEVKRAGWRNYIPATMGMLLKNGDAIRLVSPGARATIFCADASVLQVPSSSYQLQCPSNRPVISSFKGSRVTKVRGGASITNSFPIVIAPRMTKLITARPVLRWLPARDATDYRVSVIRGAEEVWSADVGDVTKFVYPASAPALVPGVTYRLVVAVANTSSDRDRTPNLGFSLLNQAEAQAVNEAAARIRGLNLPDATTRFLLANLYASWGIDPNNPDSDMKALNYEAIEQLLALPEAQQEPATTRLLGDLYLTIGLNSLAEEQYRKALSLSESRGDTEGQAWAQYSLGRIYKVRLNVAEATQRLQSAKALFQSFGDAESVAKVDREISTLTAPATPSNIR